MKFNDIGETTHGRNRSLFGWFPRLGMNLLAFAADAGGGAARDYRGEAIPPPCNQPITPVKCCNLACPNTECPYDGGNKASFRCPEGYNKTAWTCCEGSRQIACGECASGTNCHFGPWYCSIWFYTGASC